MALPFSSTDYSEPGQNLSFANDISNLQTQINTLASESDAARYGALELGIGQSSTRLQDEQRGIDSIERSRSIGQR